MKLKPFVPLFQHYTSLRAKTLEPGNEYQASDDMLKPFTTPSVQHHSTSFNTIEHTCNRTDVEATFYDLKIGPKNRHQLILKSYMYTNQGHPTTVFSQIL